MPEYIFLTTSPGGTYSLGKLLGEKLPAGTVLALIGELGCGKTVLAKGICAGLGVLNRVVSSPTFVIINEYQGRLPVLHMDLYRLNSLDDGIELGILDYLRRSQSAVMIVEWAEKIESMLPRSCLTVRFEYLAPRKRRLVFATDDECLDKLTQELKRE